MNYTYTILAFLFVGCLQLSACAPGTGEGLDSNGNPITPGSQPIPLSADFVSIQANIFTPNCALSGCHSGNTAPLGLRLDTASSYAAIYGQDSSQVPVLKIIAPLDADNSYLVRKIEGNAGTRMPLDLPALTTDKIQAIRDWVNNGALGPSLTSIQLSVFDAFCITCHFGTAPAGSLNLEDGQSRSNLVGIQRPFDPEIRVVAGNANSSFLIDKLEGNNLGGARGDRMPIGGQFLSQNTIDVIRLWIDRGALDD